MDGVLWTTGNKNTIWNKLSNSSDANSASYVEENDLADVSKQRATKMLKFQEMTCKLLV